MFQLWSFMHFYNSAHWWQDTGHNGARDRVPWKNDSCMRGKHANGWVLLLHYAVFLIYWWKVRVIWDCQLLTPGIFYSGSETSSARSSGPLGLRLTTPLPNSGTNSLPPPPLSSASSSGSATHTPNGMNFSVAYPQPSPLPKPNGKEAINLILHWSTACHLSQYPGQKGTQTFWGCHLTSDPCIASHSWQFSGCCKVFSM